MGVVMGVVMSMTDLPVLEEAKRYEVSSHSSEDRSKQSVHFCSSEPRVLPVLDSSSCVEQHPVEDQPLWE